MVFSETQNRAEPPANAPLDHERRSEMLNVVEMAPLAWDAEKIAKRDPLLVETKLAPFESCPLVIVKVEAKPQLSVVSPLEAMNCWRDA